MRLKSRNFEANSTADRLRVVYWRLQIKVRYVYVGPVDRLRLANALQFSFGN